MRVVIVAFSDIHSGTQLSLCNPDVILPADDEIGRPVDAKPELRPWQKQLWNFYQEDLWGAQLFAGSDPIVLFVLGDITQGKKYPDYLMSSREADQIFIAASNLEYAIDELKPVKVDLAKGTGSHAFGEGSAEVVVAELLRRKYSELPLQVTYHGIETVGGMQVDYKHHGSGPGIRDWTDGNAAYLHLKDMIARHHRHGKARPPRLYLTAHYHSYIRVARHEQWQGDFLSYDLITLPSYCGLGNYGHQVTKSIGFQDFGMVAIEVIDGELGRIMPLLRVLDIRTRSVIA